MKEDAGDVLISLASLLAIEGSASAPTKIHAAKQVYEYAPSINNTNYKNISKNSSDSLMEILRESHELFVRSAITISMMSLSINNNNNNSLDNNNSSGSSGNSLTRNSGGTNNNSQELIAAARMCSEVAKEWKEFFIKLLNNDIINNNNHASDVFNLFCTMQICFATCILYSSNKNNNNDINNNDDVPALTEDVYLAVQMMQSLANNNNNDDSITYGAQNSEYIQAHAQYCCSLLFLALASEKQLHMHSHTYYYYNRNNHDNSNGSSNYASYSQRDLYDMSCYYCYKCYSLSPLEANYVYNAARILGIHTLRNSNSSNNGIDGSTKENGGHMNGSHINPNEFRVDVSESELLSMASSSVQLTRGRSCSCWILLSLLLSSNQSVNKKLALQVVNQAMQLNWVTSGSGNSSNNSGATRFSYIELLIVKAAILSEINSPNQINNNENMKTNKQQSMDLLIEALARLKYNNISIDNNSSNMNNSSTFISSGVDARRRKLISYVWQLLGTIYLDKNNGANNNNNSNKIMHLHGHSDNRNIENNGEANYDVSINIAPLMNESYGSVSYDSYYSDAYAECMRQAVSSCNSFHPSGAADAIQLLAKITDDTNDDNYSSIALASLLIHDSLDEDMNDSQAYKALAMLETIKNKRNNNTTTNVNSTFDKNEYRNKNNHVVSGNEHGLVIDSLIQAARLESASPVIRYEKMLPNTPFM